MRVCLPFRWWSSHVNAILISPGQMSRLANICTLLIRLYGCSIDGQDRSWHSTPNSNRAMSTQKFYTQPNMNEQTHCRFLCTAKQNRHSNSEHTRARAHTLAALRTKIFWRRFGKWFRKKLGIPNIFPMKM